MTSKHYDSLHKAVLITDNIFLQPVNLLAIRAAGGSPYGVDSSTIGSSFQRRDPVHCEPVTCLAAGDSGCCLSGSKDQVTIVINKPGSYCMISHSECCEEMFERKARNGA